MEETSIRDKHRLDSIGIKKRQEFLSAYHHNLKTVATRTVVTNAYSSLLKDVLGSSSYIFVSVNLTTADLRKAFAKKQRSNNGLLPSDYIRLGQEFVDSIRSGTPAQAAAESLWNKFFIRLNQKVLGARYKRYGQSLKWFRVYENETKGYAISPTNHTHMLVEVPTSSLSAEYNELKFKSRFRELFSTLVCPLSTISANTPILNIKRGRLTNCNPHPKYILKQLINWEVASDRLFTSGVAKSRDSVGSNRDRN